MRYLVISDIHGNAHALEAVLADAAALGYDGTLCLGDLVGYGADPAAVLDRVRALAPVGLIRGNHDKVCAGLEPATLFNEVARRAAEWTRGVLTADALAELAALPKGPQVIAPTLEICHGAPFDEDHYIFDAADAGRAMDAAHGRICLFGHTHLPAVFTIPQDPAARAPGLADDELSLPATGPALINVGSVGQPRDGDPRAAYGLLDMARKAIRLRRVVYDVAGAQRRIREAGLPAWRAHRLAKGQ
jgi:diadenosine tetraphosphatase ApaH/serine/threonine PP2A family protein phosphatase